VYDDLDEAKEQNKIILGLEEKEVESRPTLEVIVSIVSELHSHTLHWLDLEIEVNLTK